MTESAFGRMAERLAKGAQSLGTGSGTGYTSQASNGVAIAEKLKTIATGAGIAGTVRSLKGDTLGFMSRLKSYGLLKGLGTVALAGTAFEVGWQVGSKIAGLLGITSGSESNPSPVEAFELTAVSVTYKDVGDNLCAATTSTGPCKVGSQLPATEPLAVVNWQPKVGSLRQDFEEGRAGASEGKCTPEYGLSAAPAGGQLLGLGSSDNFCGGKIYAIPVYVMTVPVEIAHLPGEEFTPDFTKESAAQTPQDAAPATDTAEECLMGLLGCNLLPGWWWNHDVEAQADTEVDSSVEEGLDPADPLQVRVPKPGAHESYQAYGVRLEKLELDPEPVVLGESAIDPARGPEEVVSTSPKANTQVEPESTVRVRYNPASAPEPGSGFGTSGPGCEATVGSVNLGPLNQPVSDHFPFGVVAFFVGWIGEWTGEYPPPQFDLTMVPEGTFGSDGLVIHVDLSKVEALVEPARIAFIFLSFVGLLWFLGTAAMKLQGDSS
ncbi:MAG: PASTA domain-containing protein [Solirubrobacterales bacterium]